MRKHLEIVEYCEACYERHGDTHLGFGWPRAEDVPKRHEVMLEVIRPEEADRPLRLLDFGCGSSQFYEHIQERELNHIQYAGLDLSRTFIERSQAKFPENTYFCLDVLEDDVVLPRFDYVVMNGVFTVKRDLSFSEMLAYFKNMVPRVFAHAERGIAFNVMSKQVDWERDDLFHLPLDTLAEFLTNDVSRHFVIRNDYGLYEYTTYVYAEPQLTER